MSSEVFYKLMSKDDILVQISQEAIKQSKVLADLVGSIDDVSTMTPLPVNNVSGDILKLISEWCEQHKGEAFPLEGDEKNTVVPEWDQQFLSIIPNDDLFNLVTASHYLDVPRLMNYSCKTIAGMTKGKSPHQLRMLFNIPTDEEDEEEERAAQLAELEALDQPSTSGA